MNKISRRDVFRAGVAALLAAVLPREVFGLSSASSADVDVAAIERAKKMIDPELMDGARWSIANPLPPLGVQPTVAEMEAVRNRGGHHDVKFLSDPPVVERMVPRADGGEVKVYVINAKPGTARGAILHTHGGGYVLGSAKNDVPRLQELAAALDCVVVTVDYRLSPEVKFPAALEDNYAGLKWLYANAKELGADPARIALAGESAGGGHAAILAIAARDRGEVPVVFQCLTYPMLDDRTGSGVDPASFLGAFGWTRAWNRIGWSSFLGQRAGEGTPPAGSVPARVTNLAGLPPAWIGVGGLDLFLDEDIEYARRLMDAGVATELLVVPGAYHAFEGNAHAAVSKAFTKSRLDALARALK